MPCEYCKPSLEPKKIVRIPDPDPKDPGENRYGYRIYRKGNFHGFGSLVFYSNANGEFAELPARFCPMCGDPLVTEK